VLIIIKICKNPVNTEKTFSKYYTAYALAILLHI